MTSTGTAASRFRGRTADRLTRMREEKGMGFTDDGIFIPPPLMQHGTYGMNQTVINQVLPTLTTALYKATPALSLLDLRRELPFPTKMIMVDMPGSVLRDAVAHKMDDLCVVGTSRFSDGHGLG